MSELENLLEDIRDGKSVVKDEEGLDLDKSSSVTTEEIPMEVIEEGESPITVKSISEEGLQAFNNYLTRAVISKNTANVSKVDKAIVLEAMASLPNGASPMSIAKLTNAPSGINKDVLDSILIEDRAGTETEFRETVSDTLRSIEDYLPTLLSPVEELNRYVDTISPLVELKLNSVIMYNNEAHNLLLAEISHIAYMDSSLIEYDKYSSGALTAKFGKVETFIHSSDLLSETYLIDRNLLGLFDILKGPIKSRLENAVERITSFNKNGSMFLESGSGICEETLQGLSTIRRDVETYNSIVELLDEKGNILDAFIELLEFLD